MTFSIRRSLIAGLAGLGLAAAASAQGGALQMQGPSSSQSPYLVGQQKGVIVVSLLSSGDSVNLGPNGQPYRFAGIPDGLGVFDAENGQFGLFCNHELNNNQGVSRAHSTTGAGAFVSQWKFKKPGVGQTAFEAIAGEDLIRQVSLWDATTSSYLPATPGAIFARFCSADLPAKSAWRNGSLGFNGRLFMNGEEGGLGRVFAHVVSGPLKGTSYELPRLGRSGVENVLANPGTGNLTLVAVNDDSTPGQVYFYVGQKQSTGSPVDQAGLTNGSLYGVAIPNVLVEDRVAGLGGATTFNLVSLGDVSGLGSVAALDALSDANGVTKFLRPEDGAWNPSNLNEYYFVTTDRIDLAKDGLGAQIGRSRLWRLTFFDRTQPLLGGTIDMLLDGTEAGNMFDNMAIDKSNHILIQEDPGANAHNAKVWQYDIATDSLKLIAKHDALRFGDVANGPVAPYNIDEETSGIIDAGDVLGRGWFLLTVQAHAAFPDPAIVEQGQVLALYNPDSDDDGVIDMNVREINGR